MTKKVLNEYKAGISVEISSMRYYFLCYVFTILITILSTYIRLLFWLNSMQKYDEIENMVILKMPCRFVISQSLWEHQDASFLNFSDSKHIRNSAIVCRAGLIYVSGKQQKWTTRRIIYLGNFHNHVTQLQVTTIFLGCFARMWNRVLFELRISSTMYYAKRQWDFYLKLVVRKWIEFWRDQGQSIFQEIAQAWHFVQQN